MLSRRSLSIALLAGLASPYVQRAQAATGEEVAGVARGIAQLHAILVQRGDEILVAEAPRGPGLARLANIKSCSKSLLALVLGTAVERGEIAGLSARLGDIAPSLIPTDATQGVADVTLGDLVTLRMGLEATSGRNYGAWVASRNWVAYALRQPRIAPAGGRMIYSTGTTHVLGAAIATATGQSLLSLARDRLGAPLGIEIAPWTRDPQGFYFGGNEMALTPEAMLRLAALLRDAGRYDGRQVIAEDWIRASQEPRTRSPYSGLDYGYGWFLNAKGWIIAAHPARALAVAITSDPGQPARSAGYFGDLLALLDGPILALG